ncbi:putative MFS-type transporter [Paramyrothecium foliicola]|nr:putative MFS-type transporter [Paramyrothecium foliicola]
MIPLISTSLPGWDQRQAHGNRHESIASVIDHSMNPIPSIKNEERQVSDSSPRKIGKARRNLIICLAVAANLVSFISMFSTVAGSFEFSKTFGRPVVAGQANWIAAAFSLTQSGFVLISGRLGDVYGHKRLLLVGVAILAVFSLVNAFCRGYESFIIARALTGIGAGIIMPNAVATITVMIPPGPARNVALAVFAASPPIGAIGGGLLTGMFMKVAIWWWFFIFVSLLVIAIFAGLAITLPYEEAVDKNGKVDFLGAFFGLSGLILFSFVWNQAPSAGWEEPYIIVILILSVILFITFYCWEARFAKEPILPLSVFKAPSFIALIFVVLVTYMSYSICSFYIVAWQQNLRGWTVMEIAVGWIPFIFGATFAVGLAAWLIPRLEAQWLMAIGIVSSFLAAILLATQPEQQIYWAQTFPAVVLASMCPDFIYVAAQIIASNSVKRREQGVAGSLVGTLNLYGNSLGLGFAGTIESQLHKSGRSLVLGYRAALYFGAALALAALVANAIFVRVPNDDRKGWSEEGSSTEEA